jgi:hypothetical protein
MESNRGESLKIGTINIENYRGKKLWRASILLLITALLRMTKDKSEDQQ